MAAEDWCDFDYWDTDQPFDDDLEYFSCLSDEELYKETSGARKDKLKSIRNYYKTHRYLSEKQRWCLIFWLNNRHNMYV